MDDELEKQLTDFEVQNGQATLADVMTAREFIALVELFDNYAQKRAIEFRDASD